MFKILFYSCYNNAIYLFIHSFIYFIVFRFPGGGGGMGDGGGGILRDT